MWRELLLAAGVSALLGLLAFGYDRYAFWRAWCPRRFLLGVVLFVAVNAAAGALTLALSTLMNFTPRAGEWGLNGLIYGLIAQGAVRIEPRSRDLRYIEEGRSMLAKAQAFVEHYLDHGALLRTEARLLLLSDQALFDLATYLHGRYVATDTTIPSRMRARRIRELNDAAELLAAGNSEGRGTLESYCLREVKQRALVPEMARLPAPHTQARL